MNRQHHLSEFYSLLDRLASRCGGHRSLSQCSGDMVWPLRGVYFFFEPGEFRSHSGQGLRVVRVGTHAVSHGSRTKLWHRLVQHRGTEAGGGNHRGSGFRKLVGEALSARSPDLAMPSWGQGQSGTPLIRQAELPLEQAVSSHIGAMPFVWIAICDEASKQSQSAFIERNAIALLSNAGSPDANALDRASPGWLGARSGHADVLRSGLWNSRDVTAAYDPAFLEQFAGLVG